MRIALDARPLCQKISHSIPVYVRHILDGLLALDQENEYWLYAQRDFA